MKSERLTAVGDARDTVSPARHGVPLTPKDNSCLVGVLRRLLDERGVDVRQPVLVVGGGETDLEILQACGFEEIVLSNLASSGLALDAEDLALPDDSYPVVFAHAVLHHCRCPQKALGEMVRVARKHALFVEPNESFALRALVRFGLSFPYELAAVAAHEHTSGGMRDGPIPNFIYRWTGREVTKAVSAYHPERGFHIRAYPYWDFHVDEHDLLARKETHVAHLAAVVGPTRFLGLLRVCQVLLNAVPIVRAQGNKFICAISKGELHAWIK